MECSCFAITAKLFLLYSFFMCKQIVTLGMPTVSPTERVGKYVKPKEWNELINDPDTVSLLNSIFVFSRFYLLHSCY